MSGDLPEPRACVKQVKAKAVRITVYLPGEKAEELGECTRRSHLGKREFAKIAVQKYMREVKAAGGLTWSIALANDREPRLAQGCLINGFYPQMSQIFADANPLAYGNADVLNGFLAGFALGVPTSTPLAPPRPNGAEMP